MDKMVKIAVILTALDQMSGVIGSATDKARAKMDAMAMASQKMMFGSEMIGAGKAGLGFIEKLTNAYGEQEEAAARLKMSMMQPGGILDESKFEKMQKMAQTLSNTYGGSAKSYLQMEQALKNNRITEEDILGGIGESTAKLADLFKMPAMEIATFAAHMKNDMGVGVDKMTDMMDVIQKLQGAGIGNTGAETVNEINAAMSQVGMSMSNLHVQGLEASKQVATLAGVLMSTGLSGGTVGTNLRRMFDTMTHADKVQKITEAAHQFGIQLEFFDKKGKFSVNNFTEQLTKLAALNPTQLGEVMKGFGGKQGLSSDFVQYLSNPDALEKIHAFNERMATQAGMTDKLLTLMATLDYKKGQLSTSFDTSSASWGKALTPILSKIYDLMELITVAVGQFADEHPRVAKFITAFAAVASIELIVGGFILTIQGAIAVMGLFGVSLGAVMWPITLLAGAAALIYSNWDVLGPFFTNMFTGWEEDWNQVTGFFDSAGKAITGLFKEHWGVLFSIISLNPLPYITQHWDAIAVYFDGLPTKLFDAGANMGNALWDGFKAPFIGAYDWMMESVRKIENIMPGFNWGGNGFSLAGGGGNSAVGYNGTPQAISPMRYNAIQQQPNALHSVASNGIHFSSTINLHGTATAADAAMVSVNMRREFKTLMQEHKNNQERVSYSS